MNGVGAGLVNHGGAGSYSSAGAGLMSNASATASAPASADAGTGTGSKNSREAVCEHNTGATRTNRTAPGAPAPAARRRNHTTPP
jgi:hypothetical protein